MIHTSEDRAGSGDSNPTLAVRLYDAFRAARALRDHLDGLNGSLVVSQLKPGEQLETFDSARAHTAQVLDALHYLLANEEWANIHEGR